MSIEPLVIESVPFILRVWPHAMSAFRGLSSLDRDWLAADLPRSGQQRLTWSRSTESPHDLWVLHRWNDESRTMDIDDMGYFPSLVLGASGRRPAQESEDQWDTDGGGNHVSRG